MSLLSCVILQECRVHRQNAGEDNHDVPGEGAGGVSSMGAQQRHRIPVKRQQEDDCHRSACRLVPVSPDAADGGLACGGGGGQAIRFRDSR